MDLKMLILSLSQLLPASLSAEKESVRCPDIVVKYSASIWGELISWIKKVTQFDHRSWFKYYMRPVFDLIDISVNNAFIIYDEVGSQEDKLDAKAYQRTSLVSWSGDFATEKDRFILLLLWIKNHVLVVPAHTIEKTNLRQSSKL